MRARPSPLRLFGLPAGLIGGLLLTLAGPALAEAAAATAGNTEALNRLLRQDRPAVRLTPLAAVQACGPSGCGTVLGGLRVDSETGSLQRSNGRPVVWAVDGAIAAADLPELNWSPLRGYAVLAGRRHWGQCIEFGHAGLGNSGHAQRWRTVVLVATGGASAQRITGYWAACAGLARGARPGEVMLPTVQAVQAMPAGAAALQIVWHRCDARTCVRSVDARSVDGGAGSESGQLVLRP